MTTDAIIMGLAVGSSLYVKVIIDLIRLAMVMPRWMPPIMALLFGIVFVYMGQIAAGVPIDPQRLAQGLLAGVVCGGLSVGSTELGRRGDQKQEAMRQ